MPVAKINSAEIYYEVHGQGAPLVLIAGYTCDHLFWSAMLDLLSKSFQILIFDNRAIGRTKDDGALFSLEMLADDVMGLAEYVGFNKPHTLGHSMGGAIAQIIGKKYSDKISKLLILNSAAKFNERTRKAIEGLLELRKGNVSLDYQLDVGMPWFFSRDYLADAKKVAVYKDFITQLTNPQTVRDQERQVHALNGFDSREWVSRIHSPTLVMTSEDDIIALPAEGKWIANAINGAQFSVIPGGHATPTEKPNKVNEVVINFLLG